MTRGQPAPLTTEWVTEEGRFAALAEEWDALVPARSHPFDLHCWYFTWWKAFGDADELAVCTVRRSGELVGAVALFERAGRLHAMANSHSALFRPVARDGGARVGLARALVEHRARMLELIGLPANEPWISELRQSAGGSQLLAVEQQQVSPIVDTSGDYASWKSLSKPRWGAPLERFRRKMQRDHVAQMEVAVATGDLDSELADGLRVEASGWKGQAGTAIVSASETKAFYHGIARAFHERGELRLSRIVLDGETAAFDFCLLHDQRLYLIKTAYDERFRKLAPGLVLRLSTIEHCFEAGLEAHELLGHRSAWKSKFATDEREHVTVRAYRRDPGGAARYGYRAHVRPRLKRAYRRVRSRG